MHRNSTSLNERRAKSSLIQNRPRLVTEQLESRVLLNGAVSAAAAGIVRRAGLGTAPIVQPLASTTSSTLSTTTWTSLGPTQITNGAEPGHGPVSGRISGVAADPSDPNTIFVDTAGGGVWKTTDGGSSWSPLTDNQPDLAMGAIAIAPSNPSIIYAATGEPQNSNYAYYGVGILKSTDGGATWALVGGNTFNRTSISRIVVDPTNPNNLYVANFGAGNNVFSGNAGIYHSTDGGVTWTNLTGFISGYCFFTDLQMDPSNPQHLFFGFSNGFFRTVSGVYVTNDGGSTWSQISALPNGNGISNVKLAIAPSNPQVIYASFTSSSNQSLLSMWRSGDGGVTWAQLPSTPNYLGINGLNSSALAVDPHNPNVVYAGGQNSIVQSADGGQTWTDISTSANGIGTYINHHAFSFDAGGHLLDATDGGIWRLDNAAAGSITWSDLNSNLQIAELFNSSPSPTNPSTFVAGSVDTGVAEYSGSSTWANLLAGSASRVQVDPQNASRIYAQVPGSPNFFLRSDDGGATWVAKTQGISSSDPQFSPAPFAVDPFNGDHLLYGTNHVYESFNGGDTWAAISSPGTNGWSNGGAISNVAFAPSDPTTIYATNNGYVDVTHNDGANWSQGQTPFPVASFSDIVVDPTNANVAYLTVPTFFQPHAWRTADGGVTWQDLTGNLPNLATDSIAVVPSQGAIYVGTDTGVYVTTDDGYNWSPFGTGLPNVRVGDLQYNPTLNALVATTFGRGIWEISLAAPAPLVVNTLSDETTGGDGLLSLREAVATAETTGQTITFDPSLAGGTINLDPANGPLVMTGPLLVSGLTSGRITISATAGTDLEVAGGQVRLNDLALSGSSTVLQIDSGAEAALTDDTISAPVIENGTLDAIQFSNSTYSGAITGNGPLIKTGPATLTLTGSGNHNAGVALRGGTLVGNTSTLVAGLSTTWGTTLVFDQSTLPGATDNTFHGMINGYGNVHVLGPSSVVRVGTDYAGYVFGTSATVTIDAGADVIATRANQLSASGDFVVNGTLDLGGFDQTIGSLSGSGAVYNLTAQPNPVATLTVGGNSHSTTFTGVIEDVPAGSGNPGALALVHNQSGTLTLAPGNGLSNSFSGGTIINGGSIVGNTRGLVGAFTSPGAGSSLVFDQSLGGVGDGTFVGSVNGALALTITRGTVRLGPNDALRNSGPTEVDGTLVGAAVGQFNPASAYTIKGGLDLGGFGQAIGSLAGTGSVYNSGTGVPSLVIGGLNSSTTFNGILEDRLPGASGTGLLALDKVGTGTLTLQSPDSYSGGTVVGSGAMIAAPSPGDAFGAGPIYLNGGTISVQGRTTKPLQQIVPVTGFNQDVVAEASSTDPVSSTTTSFDGALNNAGTNVLYEMGFGGPAAAGTGLPAADVPFTSLANPAVQFQLAPYTADNVALMNAPGQSITLTLQHPAGFGSINLLATGAYNGGTVNVALNFADGSTTTYPINVIDWFNGSNAAYLVKGRVKRDGTAALEIANNNPRLYEYDYALQPADQGKILNNITFTETSGNVVGIFAVSGTTLSMLSTQTFGNDVQVSADTTITVADSLTAAFGNLTLGANQLRLSGSSGATLTFNNVGLSGNATLVPDAGTTISPGSVGGGPNSLTQNGPGTVRLTGIDTYAATVVNAGTLLASSAYALPTNSSLSIGAGASVQLLPATTPFTSTLGSLSIASGGTFDLTDNSLQVSFGPTSDPVSSMRSLLASGAVLSSLSDANHVLGYATGADNVIPGLPTNAAFVRLTVPGDTNLDGTVNLADFLNVSRHFGQTNASWADGDFNYDGTVSIADLLALTRHFGQRLTTPVVATTASAPDTIGATLAGRRPPGAVRSAAR